MRAIAEPKVKKYIIASGKYMPTSEDIHDEMKGIIAPFTSIESGGDSFEMYVDFFNDPRHREELKLEC